MCISQHTYTSQVGVCAYHSIRTHHRWVYVHITAYVHITGGCMCISQHAYTSQVGVCAYHSIRTHHRWVYGVWDGLVVNIEVMRSTFIAYYTQKRKLTDLQKDCNPIQKANTYKSRTAQTMIFPVSSTLDVYTHWVDCIPRNYLCLIDVCQSSTPSSYAAYDIVCILLE